MGYWDKREPKIEDEQPEEIEAASLEEVEAETIQELGAVEKSFRERVKMENKRFRDMCDTEYWFCVCFTSREQKDEFLQSIGMSTSDKYFDGREFARAVKRPVKTADIKFAKIGKCAKEYLDRAVEE